VVAREFVFADDRGQARAAFTRAVDVYTAVLGAADDEPVQVLAGASVC
jgi:hypothetical protein